MREEATRFISGVLRTSLRGLPRAGFRAPLGTWNLGTCPQFNTPFVR